MKRFKVPLNRVGPSSGGSERRIIDLDDPGARELHATSICQTAVSAIRLWKQLERVHPICAFMASFLKDVEELDLTGAFLDEHAAASLKSKLQSMCNLQILKLGAAFNDHPDGPERSLRCCDELAAGVLQVLPGTLVELHLRHCLDQIVCSADTATFGALEDKLPQLDQLRMLCFDETDLSDGLGAVLLRSLPSGLEELSMNRCRLGKSGFVALQQKLSQLPQQIHRVHVKLNGFLSSQKAELKTSAPHNVQFTL